MKNKITWLRVSYWAGAVADGIAARRMLFPKIADGAEYRYAMFLAASLMLGWTFLLIWADRKPLERKGVLLLTVCPVITGILLSEIYAVAQGVVQFSGVLPTVVLLVGLSILFTFSYLNARGAVPEAKE